MMQEQTQTRLKHNPVFFIKIIPDKTNFTITIEDSGTDVTKNDMALRWWSSGLQSDLGGLGL